MHLIIVVVQSSEEVESYMNQIGTRRAAGDFSDNVCRLLLPNGHYQHVDILRPHQLYRTFVFLTFRMFSSSGSLVKAAVKLSQILSDLTTLPPLLD